MKIKNLALTISLVSFVIGFSDLQENLFFWLGRPVGAIAFICYFICMVLEKESALFDAEQKVGQSASPKASGAASKAESARHAGVLTVAANH